MKADKGHRKLALAAQSGLFLFAGLLVICFTCWLCGLKPSDAAGLFIAYAAGIAGKDTAFMWGNSKEHEHSAGAKEEKPT